MTAQIPALSIIVASIVAFAVIMAGHYAPWSRRLRRPEAYTYGVATIIAAFGLLALMEAHAPTTWRVAWLAFIAIAGAAGVATLICYGIDSYLRMKNILRERDAK